MMIDIEEERTNEHMATQEERLLAVEQATRDSLVHMRDTDMAVTAMVGVIRSQGQDIRRLVEQGAQHTELLKAVETAIQLLSANITNLRTELLVIKSLVAAKEEE